MRPALLLAVVACACSSNDDIPSPQVASVSPDSATEGTVVVVSGSFFCQQPAEDSEDDPLVCNNMGTVLFGTAGGEIAQYTDSSIMVEVPPGTGMVQVSIEVAGKSSNSVPFTIE